MIRPQLTNFVFFLLISLQTFSQSSEIISGKVLDGGTNLPLPGVSVRIAGKTRGTVTNADGVFLLPEKEIVPDDRLVISHIGYEHDTVRITVLRFNPTIWLHPTPYLLHEVEISSKQKSLFPYQLLYNVIKKYRLLQDKEETKAYLVLQSESNGNPLEIIEGYYNCSVSPGKGIEEIMLINGRIGISSLNDKNYLSMNTTRLMHYIKPFYRDPESPFPEFPGTMSFPRFKRLYEVTIRKYLKRDDQRHFIVEFIPRKNREFFFSGVAYINEADLMIDKLEFFIPNCQVPILFPIDPDDRIRELQLGFAVYFDNSFPEHPRIDRISLGYGVDYTNKTTLQETTLQTRAELFLYDFGERFLPPLVNKTGFRDDYQAILTIPYVHSFWQQNEIMAPSERQKEILSFFRQQGILVNYNDQSHEYLKTDTRAWRPDTLLRFSNLYGSPSSGAPVFRSQFMHEKYDFQHDLYNIEGDILIQPFLENDNLTINSKTFLYPSDSYYYANKNQNSKEFINLLFDLYEVKRLEILAKCLDLRQSGILSPESMEMVYKAEMKSLDSLIRTMTREVKLGADENALKRWNEFIIEHAGVDRHAQMIIEAGEK